MDAWGSSGPARTADPRTVRWHNVEAEGTALAARGRPVTQQMRQSPHQIQGNMISVLRHSSQPVNQVRMNAHPTKSPTFLPSQNSMLTSLTKL